MTLSAIDFGVLIVYAVALMAIAWTVSREKPGHEKNTQDYFLAGKALPWWAIGASLIAANISAEQVIGMSGSGYAIGLAIASYEWMAAITLIIVGAFFLPIFLKKQIYTMPQFLDLRFGGTVRSVMAVFWLALYTVVNLTAVLWLGALTIQTMTGAPLMLGLVGLAAFAAAYSLYGGLKAVALTDVIQVVMLMAGGLLISYITLDAVSGGAGPIAGFQALMERAPEKFDMILERGHEHHSALPGLSVLLGGMWIMNLSYWGFNQYIIQRALGAKSLREAQAGIAFAAFLKLVIPVLVVFPGIAASILAPDLERSDQAYPTMMSLAPEGARGLIFAALVAAIVSSLGSMMNSIATIFTMDLYKPARPDSSEHSLVWVGRGAAFTALVIAVLAAYPLLGQTDQAFQYIQEFTGFFTPAVVVIFALGMFWKRTTAGGALSAIFGSVLLSYAFKFDWPSMVGLNLGLDTMPFMNRVGWVFLICLALGVIVSLIQGRGRVHDKAVEIGAISFKTSPVYNASAAVIAATLIGIYGFWW